MRGTHLLATLWVGGLVAWSAGSAAAQSTAAFRGDASTYSQPTLSPYLMLLPQATSDGGTVSAPAGTYQALVRPQIEARDQSFRQSLTQNQAYTPTPPGPGPQTRTAQTTGISGTVRPTGHSATYQNLSHYYPPKRP